jgi:alanyl-tRNA synthetase
LSSPWEKEVNLKEFAAFLKEKFEFKGGGSSNLIQGSGPQTDDNLEKEITKWVKLI